MRELLFLATVLLSTATCNVDVARITIIPMTTSADERETTTRDSVSSQKQQLWWKREKRKSDGQSGSAVRPDLDQSFLTESRLYAKLFELSPLAAAIRYPDVNDRRLSRDEDPANTPATEYPRYRSVKPIPLRSTKFPRPSFQATTNHLFACNSRNECARRGQQDSGLPQPFYVEEPRWIEIGNDYAANQMIRRRLEAVDPFVISRGKRIHGIDSSTKESSIYPGGSNVSDQHDLVNVDNQRFPYSCTEMARDKCYRHDQGDQGDDRADGVDQDDESIERQTKLVNKMLGVKETLAKRSRKRSEMILRSIHARANKFRLSKREERLVARATPGEDNSVLFRVRNRRVPFLSIAHRKRICRTDQCPSILDSVPVAMNLERKSKRSNLFDTLEQPYFFLSDRMDYRRFDDDNDYDDDDDEDEDNALFQRSKSKRLDLNSPSDLDSKTLTAKEILEGLIEKLECNSEECTDSTGRTMKRTRIGDGRGMLEDLLTKSDPFYVARGKRARHTSDDSYLLNTNDSPVNESMDTIYTNERNLRTPSPTFDV